MNRNEITMYTQYSTINRALAIVGVIAWGSHTLSRYFDEETTVKYSALCGSLAIGALAYRKFVYAVTEAICLDSRVVENVIEVWELEIYMILKNNIMND